MTERMKNVFIYDAIRSPRTKAKDNGGLHEAGLLSRIS